MSSTARWALARVRALGLWLAGLLLAGGLWPPAGAADQACPGQGHLLAQAQVLYAQRQDPARAERARDLYRQALQNDPQCPSAALGLAKAAVWVGVLGSGDRELQAFEEAGQAARRLAEDRPGQPAGHYWLGVALALQANAGGILSGWPLVGPAKASLSKALQLDPAYEGGGAHRALGRLYCKLPAAVGGDRRLAEWHLRQALALAPGYWLNHLYLAALLGEQKRGQEAKSLLRQVISGPAPSDLLAEYGLWRQEALALLGQLEER